MEYPLSQSNNGMSMGNPTGNSTSMNNQMGNEMGNQMNNAYATEDTKLYIDDLTSLVEEQSMRIQFLELEAQKRNEYTQKLEETVTQLRQNINDVHATQHTQQSKVKSRYWSQVEHQKFLEAVKMYGKKDCKRIAEYIGTRTTVQVRTHSQKFWKKFEKNPSDMDASKMEASSSNAAGASSSPLKMNDSNMGDEEIEQFDD